MYKWTSLFSIVVIHNHELNIPPRPKTILIVELGFSFTIVLRCLNKANVTVHFILLEV